ncbi:ABC transporter substrate-binding protein [Thermodesulforhabdus norvegica]|uniref:Amino acid ABC transporter substrate-binding protein, PAAT family n=1 Tax=Thermodesulforhabdus norvegica TaxID=39841 RepID=A0A1I4TSA4_9BACT|nr:ABC transporter substrate-binding protein [Thermodesulforhabdus norvegica]SFM79589.1 amino acid ABC transporter substrate-binding protein, PAAT family [Thermodesulforhabdus norvegica]
MRRLFGILFLVMVVGVTGAFAEERVVVNGIDPNFPPFTFVNERGEASGFDIEAVNWIAEQMGFKVKHQPMDWDSIIPSLKAGKIDMIASGLSVTEERAKEVAFTIPYWEITQVLVVRKDSNLTVEEAFSEGKKIGVQRGTSEAKWIEENLIKKQGKKFELVYYDSAPLAIEDLVVGRIDAAAMDDAPAKDAVSKKPVKILGTFGMPSEKFAYAVRKEDTELLQILNEGLKKLMNSPKWQELIEKYNP